MKFELESFLQGGAVPMVPGDRKCALFRDNEHAVRCLPLSIANTVGWQLLCPDGVTIEWNGGPGGADLKITFDHPERWALTDDDKSRPPAFAKSHFQTGIVTFQIGRLFRTSEGWSLWAMGPPNNYKDGIAPLSGVIETYWLDYSFTMNWKMTRPGQVRFEEGEAFCFITPTCIPAIAECQPVEHAITDFPELAANVRAGGVERDALMERMRSGDKDAIEHPWGRRYWRGEQPEGSTAPAPQVHYSKVRTKAPIAGPKPQPGVALFGKDGRLTPSTKTRVVRTSADTAGLDFLVVDQLLSPDQCAELRALYDRHPDLYEQGHKDAMWNSRLLGLRGLQSVDQAGAGLMRSVVLGAMRRIASHYRVKAPLYADVAHLTKWVAGQHMPVHADNANPDGSPHAMSHRAYSGLFYLSDDFDGGGLYLPHQDVLIQPRAGMFVSLPGGVSHEHGVVLVERGERYTMPFFVTHIRDKAERTIHTDLAASPSWAQFSSPINLTIVNAAEEV